MNLTRHLRTTGLAFAVALTGAMAPGPLLALLISQVLAQGISAAVWILVGHAALEALLVTGLACGLTTVLKRARFRGILAVCGGLVLAWMGANTLVQAHAMTIAAAHTEALPWYALVAAGVGVSLSNPYFTGWWATVGSGQIAALALRRPTDYGAFLIGHELGDAAWFLLVAVLLVCGRNWLNDVSYRMLLRGCGVALIGLALILAVAGARQFRQQPGSAGTAT